MNINLHLLKEELADWNFQGTLNLPPWEAPCAYCLFYDDQSKFLEKEAVYLATAEQLSVHKPRTKEISILCVGVPPQIWCDGSVELLYTEQEHTLQELFYHVQKVFYKYQKWTEALQEVVDDNLPLRELAVRSNSLIENPIDVISSEQRLIFAYRKNHVKDALPQYDALKKVYATDDDIEVPLENVRMLAEDPEHSQVPSSRVPVLYPGKPIGYRLLAQNIFIRDTAVARLSFNEMAKPIRQSDFLLITVMAEYVAKAMRSLEIQRFDRHPDISEIMSNLLSGSPVSESKMKTSLAEYHWNMTDDYICLIVFMENKVYERTFMKVLSLFLSKELSSYFYKSNMDSCVMLCNLSTLKMTRTEFVAKITPISESNRVRAIVGKTYHDFTKSYYFYQHTMLCKELGLSNDPSQRCFDATDYEKEVLIHQYLSGTIPETLIPEGLYALLDHDKKNDTKYAPLLRQYLDLERSIIQTTRAAFLHRSTFYYQLQKIQSILNMDLENPDERLLLQIAFRVLDTTTE